jgi:hypothetical protein
MDLEAVAPGVDFVLTIRRALHECDVVLVLIGPSWLTLVDGLGNRRLDDPNDVVRLEVEAALSRTDVVVIPTLVQGASMPTGSSLPRSLQALARWNAFSLSDRHWNVDLGALIGRLSEIVPSAGVNETEGTSSEQAAQDHASQVGRQRVKWKGLFVFGKGSWHLGLGVLAVLAVILLFVWIANSDGPHTYVLTVRAEEPQQAGIAFIPMYSEPNGQPLLDATGPSGENGLIAGMTYNFFECVTSLPGGSEWVRYHLKNDSSKTLWAPRPLLRAPNGDVEPNIPTC